MSACADLLLFDLDSAASEAERAVLLGQRSPEELAALNAALAYRAMNAEVRGAIAAELAEFEAFSRELDGAPDDDERVRLIKARSAEFGAAWRAWRQPNAIDTANDYFALLKPASVPP